MSLKLTTETGRRWTPIKTSPTSRPSRTTVTVKWRSLLSWCLQLIVSWQQVRSEVTRSPLMLIWCLDFEICSHPIGITIQKENESIKNKWIKMIISYHQNTEIYSILNVLLFSVDLTYFYFYLCLYSLTQTRCHLMHC